MIPVGMVASGPDRSVAETSDEMSAMQSDVFEAFRAIDIAAQTALKAVIAAGRRDDDSADIKTELPLMNWMPGFVLALQIAIAVKLFVH
jgi:hypothetical protein